VLLNSFAMSSDSAERAERAEALAGRKVPYTLDPLLASLARDFVDDLDLSNRLRRLFQAPPPHPPIGRATGAPADGCGAGGRIDGWRTKGGMDPSWTEGRLARAGCSSALPSAAPRGPGGPSAAAEGRGPLDERTDGRRMKGERTGGHGPTRHRRRRSFRGLT
jgi:hypothetical protein